MTDAENTKPQEEQPVIPPKPEDAIPDGIGLSLEQVQELLAKTHKKVVDYHDPILMVVTMLNAHLAEVDMRKLAKVSMRYAPKRILVGEVRDAAALEMLKL